MASPPDRQQKNRDEAVDARTKREARLAAALRDNLKRRKAQAQARNEESQSDQVGHRQK
jgi:hypothetical protein